MVLCATCIVSAYSNVNVVMHTDTSEHAHPDVELASDNERYSNRDRGKSSVKIRIAAAAAT